MNKINFQKFGGLICLISIIIQVLYVPISAYAENRAIDDSYVPANDVIGELSDEQIGSVDDITEDYPEPVTPAEEFDPNADYTEPDIPDDQQLGIAGESSPWNEAELDAQISVSKLAKDDKKIILNGTDEMKLQQMKVAASVIPNFELEPEELASATGRSIDEIMTLKKDQHLEYYKLANDQKKKISNNSYVAERLMANPEKLSEFLGIEVGEAIDELENERDFLTQEIIYELEHSIDKRVIKALRYLVTPKNQGGAGHYKIKVERITKNYNSERKKGEREDMAIRDGQGDGGTAATNENKDKTIEGIKADETNIDRYFDPTDNVATTMVADAKAIVDVVNAEGETTATALIGDNELEPETVSSHFSGQGVDISEIDDIKCTLIEKKRIGKDKKTPQAPQPIKLLYQTKAGYNSDKDKIDASYNQMFLSASQSALENMFAGLNLDATSISNQEFNNFSDIAEAVGKSVFGQALDAPLKDIWNNNLADMIRLTGGAALADRLGLPREPFLDGNIDSVEELTEALGRSYIERNLNLPYGALRGESRDDILTNIGLSRIAQELRLPTDTFTGGINNTTDMNNRIGSRILEYEFGFPAGSFFGKDNMNDLLSSAGRNRIDSFFRDPNYIDGKLGIPKGTTSGLRSGSTGIKDYVSKVAGARLLRSAYAYPNYNGGSGCDQVGSATNRREVCTTNQATVGNKSNWRDEMMGLPEGTMDSFLATGNISLVKDKLKNAGIDTLVKNMEKNDKSRTRLTTWLTTPTDDFTISEEVKESNQTATKKFCLPVSAYAAATKLDSLDFYKVFGQGDNARGIFKRLGKSLMSYGLKPDGKGLKLEKEALSSMPKFNFPVAEDSFYKNKSAKMLDSAQDIRSVLLAAKDSLNGIGGQADGDRVNSVQSALGAKAAAIDDSVKKLKDVSDSQAIINFNTEILNQYYSTSTLLTDSISLATKHDAVKVRDINSAIYKLESIGKSSYEISIGNDESDFRFEDINIKDIKTDVGTTDGGGTTYIDRGKVALLLSGRVDFKTFLSSMGSSRLGSIIDLPASALTLAAEAVTTGGADSLNISDMLVRSVSLRVLEESSGLDLTKISANDLKDKVSINDMVSLFSNKLGASSFQAKSMIAEALNLGGKDLDGLMNGDFRAWSGARVLAQENDIKNKLPKGTTENFIKNQPLGKYDTSLVSKKELTKLSDAIGVSEPALKTFIAKKEGASDPKYNKIYFKSFVPEANDASANKKLINAYFYQDKKGIHEFETYDAAEDFRSNHSEDEIDYLDEISSSLSNKVSGLGGKDNIKEKLSSFLSTKNKAAVGDAQQTLENTLFNLFGVDRGTTMRIFSRSGDGNSTGAVDFLKILGAKYLSREVLPQINSDMDIKSGFAALDANDLVKIFNGEGRDILSKAGAFLTDKEMGTTPGTIMRLMLTDNDQERESMIRENAFELLGKALGVTGVDYSNAGNIAKEFGLGKIEEALSLPSGTFKGNNLDEIINNISPFNLVTSFSLPVSDNLRNLVQSIISSINPAGSSSTGKSVKDQLGTINAFRQSSGFDGLPENARNQIKELESGLKNTAKAVLGNVDIQGGNVDAAVSALRSQLQDSGGVSSDFMLNSMLDSFRNQISSVEGMLGLNPSNLMQGLLGQNGSSVDNLITSISRKILSNDGENSLGNLVASVLNVGNKTISAESIGKMIRALQGSLSNGIDNALDVASFGGFLDGLFTSNFDDKAHFTVGTFTSIFQNKGDTALRLLEQGLSTLDSQFGTTESGNNMRSFSNIANSISAMANGGWASLLTAGSDIATVLNSQVVPTPGSSIGIQDIADQIASTAFGTISRETGVTHTFAQTIGGITETIEENVNSIMNIASMGTTLVSTFENIFNGDFRPLQVIGVLNSIPKIVGKECTLKNGQLGTCLSVPENMGFLFNVENIYASVFGSIISDPGAEDFVADHASEWMGEMTAARASDAEGAVNTLLDGTESNQGVFGDTNSGALPTFDDPTGQNADPGSQYASEYANTHFPTTGGIAPGPLAGTPEFNFLQSKLLFAESLARVNFQDSLGKLFQFKAMDCNLFKDNSLIPFDFARTLFEGNAFDKINILKTFLGKWAGTDGALGKLTEIFGTGFNPVVLIDMFNGKAGEFNVEGVASALGLDLQTLAGKLDSIIMSAAPTIFGVNLGEGVSGSLMAFIQTGDLANSFNGVLESFKQHFTLDGTVGMVTSWGDQQLGLPPGTLQSLYNNIVGIESAQFSFAGASFAGPYAIIASILFQKIKSFVMGFVMNIATKIVGAVEEALGLVPGSLMALILSGFTPIGIAIFVIQNLFGVYKVLLVCTADGYYPSLESPPDDSVWDNGHLGTFDGMNSKAREAYYIKAAQYKADRLIKDLLEMPINLKDDKMVPVQIMTGRQEDIGPNVPMVNYSICPKVESSGVYPGTAICNGWNSRSGLWSNPQTTAWTHIGF